MSSSASAGGQLLDPAALLDLVPRLLPSSGSSTTTASGSQLRNPSDALVALLHAILTRLSFRLVSVGEGSSAYNVASSPSAASEDSAAPPNVLPPSWNSSGPSSYALTYTHDQSSLRFLLKIVPLGPRTLVHGTALEDDRTATFEFETDRYTSKAFWPNPPDEASAAASHPEPLVNGYVSSSRIKDLVLGFQAHVVQKLVPGLRKEGYEEVTSAAESGSSAEASSSRAPGNSDDAQRGEGAARVPPGGIPSRPPFFEDPDDPTRPFGVPPAFPQPGRSPFAIGDRDLDPLGGRSPLRLPGQGGGGFGPPPLFPGGLGGDNGGGMIVGPDHPMFRDRFPQQGGGGGPFGGDGVLPPGAVPPGARFDPIGPFDPPGGGRGGGPMRGGAPRPRGGGPRPPGFGSGDPDWDDVRPPRGDYDNMFG